MDNRRDLSDRWRPRPDLCSIMPGRGEVRGSALILHSPLGEKGRGRGGIAVRARYSNFSPAFSQVGKEFHPDAVPAFNNSGRFFEMWIYCD